MPLFCECDLDPERGMDWWTFPNDYSTLQTNRRQRCCSCNALIDIGSTVAKFSRCKIPETEIEIKIYGEDDCENGMPRATKYHCEGCADLYFSLDELGFCGQPWENQRLLVKEYAETYGARQ